MGFVEATNQKDVVLIKINLLKGDCLEKLKELPKESIDSIITDPPYGLSFMGKKWDYDVPSVAIWQECLRVLKPGGHLLSFGGTRTNHRLVVNIEDAGFEIRDCIQWIYGSGFPKSTDVSKRIDKEAGVEREVIGTKTEHNIKSGIGNETRLHNSSGNRETIELNITMPASDSAKQWQGWGTALKPANEPICVARKPLEKGLTVAENVLKWGTGALNIDGSRIEANDGQDRSRPPRTPNAILGGGKGTNLTASEHNAQGRWPANVLFDEDAAEMLDEQSGEVRSAGAKSNTQQTNSNTDLKFMGKATGIVGVNNYSDKGGASRFFYVAKASKSDRGTGNNHPTVKPIKLMQYLIKLVTPPNGTVLDPFMGSGSTGVAATSLGFAFVGCEMNEDYFKIAEKRIKPDLERFLNGHA